MTTTDERFGGRLWFGAGFGAAVLLLIGGGAATNWEASPLSVASWAGGAIATGAIIGGMVGSYNLGRKRGR